MTNFFRLGTRFVPATLSLSGSAERLLVPLAAVGGAPDLLVVEVVHDGGMTLGDPLIRRLVVHKAASVFPGHLLGLLFQQFEVGAVFLVVDLVVERHQLGV